MKKLFLIKLIFLFSISNLFAQNQFDINIEGINESDSIRVIVQKSAEILLKDWVHYNGGEISTVSFDLSEGEWAVKLDATGYTYPSQQIINIPTDVNMTWTLTPLTDDDYDYTWQDDGSAAGHATQRYINEPARIVVLNDSIAVPDDFSAVKLRTEYGVILSDSIQPWSNEDSYRLYKMFSNLPYNSYGEGNGINYETGENIRGVFMLTDQEQDNDLSIDNSNQIPYATVSQSAFVYAEPQIVTIDGIRGKFFSKRLYHTVVNFITDFANDDEVVSWLANERFGIKFMRADQETEDLMNEDQSNFQEFFKSEKLEILAMFEELPEGFHKQEGLKYLVRRINGQDNPQYPTAAAIAWTGFNTMEFMSKAFNGGDINDSRRLILHEKAHFLWAYSFDQELKDDWADLGDWFEDPTSASGWSTTNTTESVSAYAHLKSPNEDLAESIAFYLTNPDALLSVSVRKYEFVRDRIMHGTRYIAQIREDLTFTVYNLFPDYTYPGKVTKIELQVEGGSEEDKLVTIRATLNSEDPSIDGASGAYLRFASSIGTIHDIGLSPENGQNQDSILVGTTTFSYLEKSGYWSLASFRVEDPVGNARNENTSTLGMKLYIENPLEDVLAPSYNYNYNYEIVEDKFITGGVQGTPNEDGEMMKALKINFSHYDASPTSRGYARLIVPNNNGEEVFEKDIQGGAIVNSELGYDNDFNSDKHFEMYLLLYDYLQSGYYSTTFSFVSDIAGNQGNVYHVKDTADFNISEDNKYKLFKEVRDSIYVETLYPDSLKPEIDINNITITAEPTNPESPNGETRVDISILARDLSGFPGHESGVWTVEFTLRDPLGGIHGFQTGNGTMNNPDLDYHDSDPQNDNEWRIYNFDLLLPQGSPPGEWGMASARVNDRAGNWEQYSFVEYIRFDIIESEIELTAPLEVEITDKVVNANNVDSIEVSMSCEPCEDMNYVYTIFSLMGGNVVRGEGIFESDSISVNSINTEGVLEGIIKLTVQVTDTEDQLIATKSAEYTKDTVLPASYYSQSNLENDGTSSLDDWVVEVVVESIDVGGSYNLDINEAESSDSGRVASISIEGEIDSETTTLENLDLSDLENGDYKFDLKVTDPNGNLGESEILYYRKDEETITLLGSEYVSNSAPISVDGSTIKDEDIPQTITLSASDVDGDDLTYTIGTAPTNGTVTLAGAEAVYTPNENFNGTDSFTFTSSDGIIESNIAIIIITVNPVNDPPVAQDGSNTKEEDTDQTITLSASDVDGDDLTYSIGTAPTNGTVTLTGAEVVYTPNENFNGSDSFTFTSSDGTIESNAGTVAITVTAVNDAPVAQDGSNTKEEDTDQTITLSASDVDGDDLTYSIGTAPTNGTVTLTGAEVVYTPNENFNGSDSFTFTSSDGTIESNAGTVAITVTAVNDAPVAQDGSNTKEEDTDQTITLSASDVDGDDLTYSIGTAPTNGTVTLTGAEVVYTPNENFNGSDSFTFTSSDGTIESNAGTVAITVTAVNDAPVAQDGSNTKEEDTDQTITLSASDVDGDDLTYSIGTAPTNGTVTLTGAEVVYTPNENFNGSDSFTFTSSDGTIESNAGTVAITVTAVNDAPVAQDGSNTKEEDTDQTITLSASDVDGDDLTYSIGTAPTNGTVTLTGAEVVYTPNENFNGSDSFTFTSSDGTIESNAGTVAITVTAVNDAPVTQDGTESVNPGVSRTFSLIANDIDGDDLTYSIINQPTNGSISINENQATYISDIVFLGEDNFTFSVSDGELTSNISTISINVTLGTLGELEYSLNNVKSYPNPVDEFYIIESVLPLKIEICDVNGRILIRKNLDAGENKIDASDLASGYYIIKMHHLAKSASRTLIKM